MQADKGPLLIFTSDNGPVLNDGYLDEANEKLGDHRPRGKFRAGKYSKYEGGTRVPFVARWPGKIVSGTTSDALFGQIDLAVSLSALCGADRTADGLPDSRDELDTLLGQDPSGREHLVHEAGDLSLRKGSWKFVSPGKVRDGLGPWKQHKVLPSGELYDLASDPREKKNLAAHEPAQLLEMKALLEQIRNNHDGDSRD